MCEAVKQGAPVGCVGCGLCDVMEDTGDEDKTEEAVQGGDIPGRRFYGRTYRRVPVAERCEGVRPPLQENKEVV